MGNGSRLEYVSSDVRDQKGMWEVVEEIGDKERRMDICVAAAGVFKPPKDCLDYPAAEFKEVLAPESLVSGSKAYQLTTGIGSQHQRRSFYCSSCRKADG
jgi:hypothetical protein